MAMLQKMKLDDLRVGMVVTTAQLEDIYGVWIHLVDYDKAMGGRIIYMTSDADDCNAFEITGNYLGRISVFYQNPEYANEEVVFYE